MSTDFTGAFGRRAMLRWLAAGSAGLAWPLRAASGRPEAAPPEFGGRLLVGVSDGDMEASTYLTGRLATSGRDVVSVIALDAGGGEARIADVPIGNSVVGGGVAIATPDGRYVIVVETRGPRPAGRTAPTMGDLPLGRSISVLDVADPARPKAVQRVTCPARPESVSINAAGSLVVVNFGADDGGDGAKTPLGIYPFRDGRLGMPVLPQVPGWTYGHEMIDAQFAPHDDLLALLDRTQPSVSFVRVTDDGRELVAWGGKVELEKAPVLVRFTPDGRHVLATATYVGPDVLGALAPGAGAAATPPPAGNVAGAPRGTLSVVRLAAEQGKDGAPVHQLVARAPTGVIPEGLAISPDGRWAVTGNAERSFPAFDDPRQGFYASLSLFRLDPPTGGLHRIGDFPFDGILPESIVFDRSSRCLAATSFDHFHRRVGSIGFWRLAIDPFDSERAQLVQLEESITVARGAHTLVMVR